MKVLVVGGGGREHAIIRKLRENPEITGLYALPGNGGMDGDAVCVPVSAKDIDGIVSFAQAHAIGFAVVAPDDPLLWVRWTPSAPWASPASAPRPKLPRSKAARSLPRNSCADTTFPRRPTKCLPGWKKRSLM